MKRRSRYIFLLLMLQLCLLLWGCGSQAREQAVEGGYDVVDAQGTKVHMSAKPQRILTYTSGADEIVLGLVPPEMLVAVNDGLANPRTSNLAELVSVVPQRIPRNPSIETVMSLRPDIVIVQDWIQADNIASLRDLGVKVIVCRTPHNVPEIKETIRIIAAGLGEPERGEKLVGLMQQELDKVAARVEAQPQEKKQKVMTIISIMAGYGGTGSLVDDFCRYAQCQNARALMHIKKGQSMTKEQLVSSNPDFLLFPVYEQDGTTSEEKFGAEYLNDPSLATLNAVRQQHICHPWARYLYNISQNFPFGVQEIARCLYGEEFAQPHNKHLKAY